jgi:hypothetical protein
MIEVSPAKGLRIYSGFRYAKALRSVLVADSRHNTASSHASTHFLTIFYSDLCFQHYHSSYPALSGAAIPPGSISDAISINSKVGWCSIVPGLLAAVWTLHNWGPPSQLSLQCRLELMLCVEAWVQAQPSLCFKARNIGDAMRSRTPSPGCACLISAAVTMVLQITTLLSTSIVRNGAGVCVLFEHPRIRCVRRTKDFAHA